MRKTVAVAILVAFAVPASAQVHVHGYYRKDGTYVQPHERTAPNNTKADNYSSYPNVNPYTGKQGTVDPYSPPSVPTYKPYTPTPVPTYTPYKTPCYYNCK